MLALLAGLATLAARQVCEPNECGGAQALSACPVATTAAADLVLTLSPSNLYFFNAAKHPVSINYVSEDNSESPAFRMASSTRQEVSALAGEVWRARALRPGHPQDNIVMLEHRVGLVSIKDCDCPQPEFVDVSCPAPARELSCGSSLTSPPFPRPLPPYSAPNLHRSTRALPRTTLLPLSTTTARHWTSSTGTARARRWFRGTTSVASSPLRGRASGAHTATPSARARPPRGRC